MIRRSFLPAVVLVLTLFGPAVAQAGKALRAEHFDVVLVPEPGGDVLVTETVVFRFDGGPFTRAFRHLSRSRTDDIDVLEARLAYVALPESAAPAQVEMDDGDPIRVTWHFPPATDTTRTFILRYRLRGAVGTGIEDVLARDVVPEEHDYRIDRVTVRLAVGPGIRLLEAPALDRDAEVTTVAEGVQLATVDVAKDEKVRLVARFHAGDLESMTPAWQARDQANKAATRRLLAPGLGSLLAAVFGGGLLLYLGTRSDGRPRPLPFTGVQDTPPTDLAPALAGRLLSMPGSHLGTFVDLARRGTLHFRRDPASSKSEAVTVELAHPAAARRPHERALLALLFEPGESSLGLDKAQARMLRGSAAFGRQIEQELIDANLIDPARIRNQQQMQKSGLLMMLAGLCLLVLGAVGIGLTLARSHGLAVLAAIAAGLGTGFILLALARLIQGMAHSPLTLEGERQKLLWGAFRSNLQRMSRSLNTGDPATVESYVPLAVALGLGSAWAKGMEELSGGSLPWLLHPADADGLAFPDLLVAILATDASGSTGGADGGSAGGGDASGAC